MKKQKVDEVMAEIDRLKKAIQTMKNACAVSGDGDWKYYESGKYTGAVRRSSMDLTRALTRLRRG